MTATQKSSSTTQVIDPPSPMGEKEAVALFGVCSDKFGQLAAIFDVIRRKADSHSDMRTLADLGWDVAMDYENQADCWKERVESGGIAQ